MDTAPSHDACRRMSRTRGECLACSGRRRRTTVTVVTGRRGGSIRVHVRHAPTFGMTHRAPTGVSRLVPAAIRAVFSDPPMISNTRATSSEAILCPR